MTVGNPGHYRGCCATLEQLGLWDTANCCGSCHVDANEYDYTLGELELPNGEWFELCCVAREAMRSLADEVLRRLSAFGKEKVDDFEDSNDMSRARSKEN